MADEKEFKKNVMENEKVAEENMKAAEVELSDDELEKAAGGIMDKGPNHPHYPRRK